MTTINNVTRFLNTKNVSYQAFETRVEKMGAIETANFLGLDPFMVFKTIVVTRQKPGKKILAVVPGPVIVDLKKVAMAVDEKKVALTTEKEAEQATGLQAGGISPLALINKGFQVVIDQTAFSFEMINISGGQRGLSIAIKAEDLRNLTNAIVADISDIS